MLSKQIALILGGTFLLCACSTMPSATIPVSDPSSSPAALDRAGDSSIDKAIIPAKSSAEVRALSELMSCSEGFKYLPVPAFQASDYSAMVLSGENPVVVRKEFPKETEAVNALLPNLSMDVAISELDATASAFGFGSKVKRYLVVMDFMKSRTEPIMDTGNNFYGYGRVGAGLRLKIELWTSDSGFDGSLIGLAASAKAKTANGRITAETVGVNNSDITLSMPFSADFSEGSIQKIIESLAIIKSKLHDPKATLVPHFLARMSCSPSVVSKK